ncbi:hypothetical protein CP532_3135 [Ophiocordyceps camponoti-leonardi (nom. inval.)]|nr:hypothetical protein CP532_3135 [Ophiocordyceps camponoti-leonardi (nom. inval.)]
MVQITAVSLAAAVIAIMTSPVTAQECKPGFQYCGSTLKRMGLYDAQLGEQLASAGLSLSQEILDRTLFRCTGGPDGGIKFIKICDNTNLSNLCPFIGKGEQKSGVTDVAKRKGVFSTSSNEAVVDRLAHRGYGSGSILQGFEPACGFDGLRGLGYLDAELNEWFE